jgi:hypothetical protein
MNALDLHVIRAALYDARRTVQAGSSPEEAVVRICRGAWREYQLIVYSALVNCIALPLPTQTPFSVSREQRESLIDLYAFAGSRAPTASMDAR